jgi:hypothetical protein
MLSTPASTALRMPWSAWACAATATQYLLTDAGRTPSSRRIRSAALPPCPPDLLSTSTWVPVSRTSWFTSRHRSPESQVSRASPVRDTKVVRR